MSEHRATLHWRREGIGTSYSRNHVWSLDDGLEMLASASPEVVLPPYSSAGRLDPESAFVGSISSCHMLWFLSIAEAHGFVVAAYRDQAVGVLGKNECGEISITSVSLNPATTFEGQQPSEKELVTLHDVAHERCFIARSVKSLIRISPVSEQAYV